MEQGTVRDPEEQDRGISLEETFHLAELLRERRGFDTVDGMRGKSVLDYPGGFKFGPPRGVTESQVEQFLAAEPAYVVWSHDADQGATYTVAYWSQGYELWVFPTLVPGAPARVLAHQWALRALLSHRLPVEKGVAG